MENLNISLFGNMNIRFADTSREEIQLTRKIQQLFAFLILRRRRPVARELLVDLFWSEYDQQHAQRCLNTALWRLRRIFQDHKSCEEQLFFTNHLGEIGFTRSADCWVDIDEFEARWEQTRKISHELTLQDESNLLQLIALYQGDLLEGLYNDWVLSERERFRLIYLSSLARIMNHYHHQHALENSVEFGRRILALDPFREDVHRMLMQLYIDLGQRAMAVRQYEICRNLLSNEMNIAPMTETQALYERALLDQPFTSSKPRLPSNAKRDDYSDALQRVEQAVENFEVARNNLYEAIQSLKTSSGSIELDLSSSM